MFKAGKLNSSGTGIDSNSPSLEILDSDISPRITLDHPSDNTKFYIDSNGCELYVGGSISGGVVPGYGGYLSGTYASFTT